jgi:molybdopterin converting factor subunit 1
MMTVRIRFFALGRELVGRSELAYTLEDGATLHNVIQRLKAEHPALERLPSCMLAINSDYADESQPLRDGDEIALIPPVSGG